MHQNPRLWGSYEAEVENVRTYLTNRIQWMDKKLHFDATTLNPERMTYPETTVESAKILQDGQLYILRNGRKYTVTGQEIQ